ncbi:putative Oil body-associated protein [Helianthus annuus]|uniref:Oil body-associated protein n=1 Tax=Helianthus annuus TaxID=4232 RepID=A0A9K3GZR7_HELAN|nr:putative Oil body-associated protein [Helianthus annuus]KAJ0439077.1 putative Oil body-associated protein [Helianthus annuus]KAJ0444059.1 putative Oil body-associated protein [Helianthus annuus]KAJ0461433.1 putative Oil body-associated protein [Helianthus annuus]KAJ0641857.1 putative Oil body-associated protein [Helianthus annuus]
MVMVSGDQPTSQSKQIKLGPKNGHRKGINISLLRGRHDSPSGSASLLRPSEQRHAAISDLRPARCRCAVDHAGTLPDTEKPMWHSHEYEVKSGVLFLPGVPGPVERKDLEKVAKHGKTIHF